MLGDDATVELAFETVLVGEVKIDKVLISSLKCTLLNIISYVY